MQSNTNDRLISDRADCFVERYDLICKMCPKVKKQFYRHMSDFFLVYVDKVQSESTKEKISKLIKKYPYIQPSIFEKIISVLNRKNMEKTLENKKYVLFE